jgi:hypothetical protein
MMISHLVVGNNDRVWIRDGSHHARVQPKPVIVHLHRRIATYLSQMCTMLDWQPACCHWGGMRLVPPQQCQTCFGVQNSKPLARHRLMISPSP